MRRKFMLTGYDSPPTITLKNLVRHRIKTLQRFSNIWFPRLTNYLTIWYWFLKIRIGGYHPPFIGQLPKFNH